MENKPLVKLYPEASPALSGQADLALQGKRQCPWDLRKFFGSFYIPIGLEFEVENVLPVSFDTPYCYWTYVKDGSLRGNALEFISIPLVNHNIDYALHQLQAKLVTQSVRGSVRTSIHCHVDVSKWDLHTLYHFTALYGMLESSLFVLHDATRQNNPYCYRIQSVRPSDVGIFEAMKYCALNLAPIKKQFTVEFRHSEFSTDWRKHRRWIQIICKLMRYCDKNRSQLRKIVEDTVAFSNYEKLFVSIFGASAALFPMKDVPTLMEKDAYWSIALLEYV